MMIFRNSRSIACVLSALFVAATSSAHAQKAAINAANNAANKSAQNKTYERYVNLLQTGQTDEIFKMGTAMLRSNPNDAWGYYYRAGANCDNRRKLEPALTDIEKALAIAPSNPDFLYMKSKILHNQQEDEAALTVIDTAYRLAPTDLNMVDLKAQIFNALHKPQDALKLDDITVHSMPAVDKFHFTRALTLKQLNRLTESENELDTAIKLSPTVIFYRQERMTMSIKLKHWKRVFDDADYVIVHEPQHSREALQKKALAEVALKQYPEAIADLKRAISDTKSDSLVRQLHVQLKEAYQLNGNMKDCEYEKQYLQKLDEDFKPL